MTPFQLHPRLLADCHVLGKTGVCQLLLHKTALVPWYILVPGADAGELHLLQPDMRDVVYEEMDTLSRHIKDYHKSKRVNVAAIGNLVPQLHVHVIGRTPEDICWPGVVWGNLPAGGAEWDEASREEIRAEVRKVGLVQARSPR